MGHQPVFTGIVELADIMFHGEPAKNKKQAEKSAALAAWSSLKQRESWSNNTVTINTLSIHNLVSVHHRFGLHFSCSFHLTEGIYNFLMLVLEICICLWNPW